MTTDTVRFPVFRDDKGNRFVFPGLYSSNDRTASWEARLHIRLALHVEEEKEPLVVPVDDDGDLAFPHLPADAISPGFAHGGSTVWIIGGPEFDAATPTKD